ncbi:hypothetical protein AMTR_s00980p00010200 [Amborella trichopoda]|uniref:Uncharacterized protein n=1 Tax=Amborella trichopoda TaxID=13333 RepID=W1NYE9_AMBTC|nr:hypothetical protein AMTR_s00980p00010200 [Amborella trichopoda]
MAYRIFKQLMSKQLDVTVTSAEITGAGQQLGRDLIDVLSDTDSEHNSACELVHGDNIENAGHEQLDETKEFDGDDVHADTCGNLDIHAAIV